MNRRTADRIRLLSRELLQEHDEKRIATLAAELRSELRKHLKHLRDRLAITEIRERRLRNGDTYDFDEIAAPGVRSTSQGFAGESNPLSVPAGDPPSPPMPSAAADAEPQAQAKEGDPPRGTDGPEIKAS
jgi:hypothetical protein